MTTKPQTVPDRVESTFVLPTARAHGELIVGADRIGTEVMLARETEVLKRVGERLSLLADCQDRFVGELQLALADLRETLPADADGDVAARFDTLRQVVAWVNDTHAEIRAVAAGVAKGHQECDIAAIARRVAPQSRRLDDGIEVVVHGEVPRWLGSPTDLAELLDMVFGLVVERIGHHGRVQLELSHNAEVINLHCRGDGEPRDFQRNELVDAFRNLALRMGVHVAPDALGPGGTGMILSLRRI